MKHEEFNATIRQKMENLTDTETNRKRQETDKEINFISEKIQEKKVALAEHIAEGRYDDAVTAKTEISRLESKQEILMGVAKELDAIPRYDDKDLRKLSDEAVNHYYSVLKGLYEERLRLLDQLDANYRRMEESKDSYNEIKHLIDSNASNFNYAYSRTYAIPSDGSDLLNDPYKIRRDIKHIEEDLQKYGYQE